MADLQRKTANLLNISQPITSAGNRYIYNGDFAFNGDAVTFKANFYCSLAMVDNNDTEIVNRALTANTALTVSIPNGIKSLRIYTPNAITEGYVMINAGSTALPYEPYGWVHSLRKLTTATEAVENPLYSDGTAITAYTIKGNTVQNGTPTQSNPVEVQGVGNKTANLLDFDSWYSQLNPTRCTISKSGYSITVTATGTDGYTGNGGFQIPVESSTTYTFYYSSDVNINGAGYIFENGVADSEHWHTFNNNNRQPITFTTRADTTYIILRIGVGTSGNSITYSDLMLNNGSTALPYEPYGYKIPISSGGVTTPMYFSQQLFKIGEYSDNVVSSGTATYNIKKLVLTGNEEISITGNGTFYLTVSGYKKEAEITCMSTHYDAITNPNVAPSTNHVVCFYRGRDMNRMYLRDTTYTTTADYQAFLAAQYAAGTPVTVYYVLATAETETVTAPSIPTTEGANNITVDTTVQPSEFSATWTGWHDSSVKEYDGSDWQ